MINYQLETERIIKSLDHVPSLLLHACCAPCTSACIELLAEHFDVTLLFYNPNIYPEEEYGLRAAELKRLIGELKLKSEVHTVIDDYNPQEFYDAVKGFESYPEGGARCPLCFTLRLGKTAEAAREMKFDYFATTLTVSPHKNAELINAIGSKLSEEYGVKYLPSDFKKREGYKRSIELSKEYNLYRQDYCGCSFANVQ